MLRPHSKKQLRELRTTPSPPACGCLLHLCPRRGRGTLVEHSPSALPFHLRPLAPGLWSRACCRRTFPLLKHSHLEGARLLRLH